MPFLNAISVNTHIVKTSKHIWSLQWLWLESGTDCATQPIATFICAAAQEYQAAQQVQLPTTSAVYHWNYTAGAWPHPHKHLPTSHRVDQFLITVMDSIFHELGKCFARKGERFAENAQIREPQCIFWLFWINAIASRDSLAEPQLEASRGSCWSCWTTESPKIQNTSSELHGFSWCNDVQCGPAWFSYFRCV